MGWAAVREWVPPPGPLELPGGDHDVEGDIDLEDLPPLSAPLQVSSHHLPLLPGAFSDHSDLLSSSGKIKQEKSPERLGRADGSTARVKVSVF